MTQVKIRKKTEKLPFIKFSFFNGSENNIPLKIKLKCIDLIMEINVSFINFIILKDLSNLRR